MKTRCCNFANSAAFDGPKNKRKRYRNLRKLFLDKVEFLFSEPNWRRDSNIRILSTENSDGGVPIQNLAQYRSLLSIWPSITIAQIATVIEQSKSHVIKLSSDRQRVLRAEPIVQKPDAYECTVFVDNISTDCNLHWLEKKFGVFGKIDYISLPRDPSFQNNNNNKGYAFIEFREVSAATKTCVHFTKQSCSVSQLKKEGDSMNGDCVVPDSKPSARKRRKLKSTCQSGDQESLAPTETEMASVGEPSTVDESIELPDAAANQAVPAASRLKTKRQRHRKRNKRADNGRETMRPDFPVDMTVLGYHDWASLKQKYKSIQKFNMAGAKRDIAEQKAMLPDNNSSLFHSFTLHEDASGVKPTSSGLNPVLKHNLRGPDKIAARATEVRLRKSEILEAV